MPEKTVYSAPQTVVEDIRPECVIAASYGKGGDGFNSVRPDEAYGNWC